MLKVKKVTLFIVAMLMLIVSVFAFHSNIAKAETELNDTVENTNADEEIMPRGVFTKMVFYLRGENGKVWFGAKNKFTLFSSTVTVHVYLYRSNIYQEDYSKMTLVASNYIYDLDQGESLEAICSTDGKQSYWKGVCSYKRDSDDWVTKISDTILFDANGIRVF